MTSGVVISRPKIEVDRYARPLASRTLLSAPRTSDRQTDEELDGLSSISETSHVHTRSSDARPGFGRYAVNDTARRGVRW